MCIRDSSYAPARPVALAFLPRTFAWMTLGLVVTAVVALFVVSNEALRNIVIGNRLVFFGAILAELAIVVTLSRIALRVSTATAALLFLVYAALNGVTLSILLMVYTGASVVSVFGISALTFAAMALYGATTKRDLTSLGSLFLMGLIGLIVAMVVNIFLQSSTLYWFISLVGVALFVGLTAYDAQRLRNLADEVEGTPELGRLAILGALTLYLDFINLFIFLLRVLGQRR